MEDSASNQPYVVSARKYRPATFSSVVGQDALTSTLKNAIETGRLAQAYLFCGPRGVGKTSCARIFARTINCEHPGPDGEACGKCDSCVAMDRGNSYNVVELDAASNNSVDDIRNLTDQVNIPPQNGRYRVFIIDEVHMLSTAAFNAFLKTLEEPPKYAVFILATTEKHKVIPTILSRCQIYDFKRITIDDMVSHLKRVASAEGIEAEEAGLGVIARKADGAMRDALSIFDQVAASSRGRITYSSTIESLNVLDYDYYFRLVDAFLSHDVPQALLIYKEILDKGFDSLFFVNGLAGHIRDLMVAYTPQTAVLLETGADIAARYTEQARRAPVEWYYHAIGLLNECDLNYRTVTDKRLHVELVLIRLCRLGVPSGIEQPQQPPQGTPQPQQEHPSQTQAQQLRPVQAQQAQAPRQPHPAQPQQQQARVQPQARTAVRAARSTVRISAPQPRQQAEQHEPQQPPRTADEPEPASPAGHGATGGVSEAQLGEAWNAFIASHGDRHILVSAMRADMPQRLGDSVYGFSVEHPGILQEVNSSLPELMDYLRKHVGNDSLELKVSLAEPRERKRVLTPREAVASVIANNRIIGGLLESINAEIV